MIPVSLITGFEQCRVGVGAGAVALVSGHWSAWQAAPVEVNQQQEARKRGEEDLAGEVVQRIVDHTDVDPA